LACRLSAAKTRRMHRSKQRFLFRSAALCLRPLYRSVDRVDFSLRRLVTSGPPRRHAAPAMPRADRAPRDGLCALRSGRDQSAFAFSRIAACSLLMSSGDNCGRSTLMVSLLSLAVSGNGGR
jgi:hypothetical protein